jgi:hypothetical protein
MKLGRFFRTEQHGDEERLVEVPLKPEDHGIWRLDEDDYMLMALLTDPVHCAELLGDDPANREYAGMFIVRDYQYPLFRMGDESPYAIAACARSVGKTESIKWRSVVHAFKRIGENLLLTAPELIHLLPLTDAVEDIYRRIRLLREFLDTRAGKTGFTHRPFGIDLLDGTKIVGRIPRLTGTGVKGQHQPDLIVDEGQDYPEKGWIEVHETVLKDHIDQDGKPDFTYHVYGVHSGARDSGFHKRAAEGAFKIVQITALQRPGWSSSEKRAAKAAYGGTTAPDYRRNILGEPGAAASPFFITARLVACMDQDRESDYNQTGYKHQLLRVEEFDELDMPISEVLDLPSGPKAVWGGMDVGLTESPTVITLWNEEKVKNRKRLRLIRRITLERFRTRHIREALYSLAWQYGGDLHGFGMDVTGLGFPIWQEMEDDEACPPHLLDVSRGYFFNAKVPVGVDKEFIAQDAQGRMRDQFGAAVVEEHDPLTGITRFVTYMPMIEASTRYLREMVDTTFLELPFDTEITSDMLGETQQRVKRIAGLKNKPNAFHILDSMRSMAMVYRAGAVEAELAPDAQPIVLDAAL